MLSFFGKDLKETYRYFLIFHIFIYIHKCILYNVYTLRIYPALPFFTLYPKYFPFGVEISYLTGANIIKTSRHILRLAKYWSQGASLGKGKNSHLLYRHIFGSPGKFLGLQRRPIPRKQNLEAQHRPEFKKNLFGIKASFEI